MKTQRLVIACAVACAALFAATPAFAADHCKLFNGSSSSTYTLPSLQTSYTVHDWGNTSIRRIDNSFPASLRGNVTRVEITAVDSAVTLYLHSGKALDGTAQALHCRKGHTCWATWSRLNANSFNCQRSFAQKFDDDKLGNPILPMKESVAAINKIVRDKAPSGVGFRNSTTEVRWATLSGTRKAFGRTDDWRGKYTDHLRIYKKFYVDGGWAVREHRVSVNVYMAPKLIDGKLRFHWAGHTYDVQKYRWDISHGRIKSEVGKMLSKIDFQTPFNHGARDAAGAAFCKAVAAFCPNGKADHAARGDWVLSGKNRLSLTHAHEARKATYKIISNIPEGRAPAIVLNSTRAAD